MLGKFNATFKYNSWADRLLSAIWDFQSNLVSADTGRSKHKLLAFKQEEQRPKQYTTWLFSLTNVLVIKLSPHVASKC